MEFEMTCLLKSLNWVLNFRILIPGEAFKAMLHQFGHIKSSFASDWPGVSNNLKHYCALISGCQDSFAMDGAFAWKLITMEDRRNWWNFGRVGGWHRQGNEVKVVDWGNKNKLVEESTGPRGSSSLNFLNELFLSKGSIF